MHTLSRWVSRLANYPQTIECPEMKVIGHDHDPPLFCGPGHLYIRSRTQIEFVMFATPCNEDAFRSLVQAKKNPHSVFDQLRLLATEYDGTEWNCGWTNVSLGRTLEKVWRLSGTLQSLITGVSGEWVSPESSVELVYDDELRLPIPGNMVTTVVLDGEEIRSACGRGRQVVNVAGTTIDFSYTPEGDRVWAIAKTTSEIGHPYAENWISEPLCLLLGQLVFPRFVARNRGDGTATISLHPSPEHSGETLVATILGEDPYESPDRFWSRYCDILTMIVNAKDESGKPNVESHPLTRFYHEIVQATTGSHWVLCMTLSSIAEGVVKMLAEPHELKSEIPETDIDQFRQYLGAWDRNDLLRDKILKSLEYAGKKGIDAFLNAKKSTGLLQKKHVDAWKSVRHRVMHGNLVSPWVDEKLEKQLWNLIELVHILSSAYIDKCVSQVVASTE